MVRAEEVGRRWGMREVEKIDDTLKHNEVGKINE